MRHTLALAVVFLVALGSLSAATFEPVTDAALVNRAQLIVAAHVLDSTSRVDAKGTIYTDSRLAVDDVLKGRAGAVITVSELGGTANGIIMAIPGSAQYTPGTRVLAFLKQRPDGTYFTASMALGQFRFKAQRDRTEVLVRDEDGVEMHDESAFAPRRASAFLGYVRDVAHGTATVDAATLLVTPEKSTERFTPQTQALPSDYLLTGGPSNLPIRWKDGDTGRTIQFKLGGGAQSGVSDTVGGVENALAAWTNDPNSFMTLTYNGLTGVDTVANNDGENSIILNYSGSLPSSLGPCDNAIACGIAWATDTIHVFDGQNFYSAFEADLVVKPATLNQGVFEAIVGHELGHTMCFKHAPSGKSALMSSPVPNSGGLRAYDKEAMAVVYGAGLPCDPPSITSTSGAGTYPYGSTKQLTVTAGGTSPFTYQWYRGNTGDTTTPVGTNSASFTTPAITATTTYWVRVTSQCSTAHADSANITVSAEPCDAPTVQTQPSGQHINPGATATLSVVANGTPTLTYKWYQGSSNLDESTQVGSASQFTTPPLNTTTSYWVRISNNCGFIRSAVATVTVSNQCVPPAITSQPGSVPVKVGDGVTLNVTASGDAPLAYQWFKGEAPDDSQPVAGATSASLSLDPFVSTGTFKYWVRVSNACNTARSTTIVVTVTQDPPPCDPAQVPEISAPPISHFSLGYDVQWTGNLPAVSYFELQEATNASFTVSRATATSAGSPSGTTSPVGTGSIHVTSGSVCRFDSTGSRAGPRSIGRARRSREPSMSRQTFVAMR